VTDIVLSEACYLNTGHPDFISGHRAMALVAERHQPPPAAPHDPKKPHPNALNNERDLDVNIKDQGFFGSFFAGGKATAKERQKHATMESPPPSLKASGQLTDRESMEVEVIRMLINSYFNIVKRTIIDMIPKATMLHLVTFAKDSLQRDLLKELYQQEVMNELMRESDHVVTRRKECVKMIAALEQASEIIATV
jgi:replication fork clamp-binding protein CrfC